MKNDLDDVDLQELLVYGIKIIAAFYNDKFKTNPEFMTNIPIIQFDNFWLHPYCFCEREDCFYCNNPNFHYNRYDLDVTWYKHIRRGMEVSSSEELNPEKIYYMIQDCCHTIERELALSMINKTKEKQK